MSGLNTQLSWISVLALALGLAGCGAQSAEGGTDGSTNWLSTCTFDSDCGGELACLCGVCTTACSSDAFCADESKGRASSCGVSTCNGESAVSTCVSSAPDPAPPAAKPQQAGDASQQPGNGELVESVDVHLDLGDPCVPGEEWSPNFRGFQLGDVGVAQSEQCGSNVCLVNNFQGRVTCPYGAAEDESSCRTPTDQEVTVAVVPQLQQRPPSEAVYCSCRCDGPDPTGEYCECGEGMECTSLIEFFPVDSEALAGSYCTKVGSNPPLQELSEVPCDLSVQSCEGAVGEGQSAVEIAAQFEPSATLLNFTVRFLPDSSPSDCLPRNLPVLRSAGSPTGASCLLVELSEEELDCSAPGRQELNSSMRESLAELLEESDNCDGKSCEGLQMCERVQFLEPEPEWSECFAAEESLGLGWCYADAEAGLGDASVTEECDTGVRLRVLGEGMPSSMFYLTCSGEL